MNQLRQEHTLAAARFSFFDFTMNLTLVRVWGCYLPALGAFSRHAINAFTYGSWATHYSMAQEESVCSYL
jgi:hypothetical protein